MENPIRMDALGVSPWIGNLHVSWNSKVSDQTSSTSPQTRSLLASARQWAKETGGLCTLETLQSYPLQLHKCLGETSHVRGKPPMSWGNLRCFFRETSNLKDLQLFFLVPQPGSDEGPAIQRLSLVASQLGGSLRGRSQRLPKCRGEGHHLGLWKAGASRAQLR